MVLSDLFDIYCDDTILIYTYNDINGEMYNVFNSIYHGSLNNIESKYWNCPIVAIGIEDYKFSQIETISVLRIEINISEME